MPFFNIISDSFVCPPKRSFFFIRLIKCGVKYCNTDTNVQFCLYSCTRIYFTKCFVPGEEGGGGGLTLLLELRLFFVNFDLKLWVFFMTMAVSKGYLFY